MAQNCFSLIFQAIPRVSGGDRGALQGSLRSPQGSLRSRGGSLRSPWGQFFWGQAKKIFQCNGIALDAFFSDTDRKTMESWWKNIETALKSFVVNRPVYKWYKKKDNKISLQILVLDLKNEMAHFEFLDPVRRP